LKLATV